MEALHYTSLCISVMNDINVSVDLASTHLMENGKLIYTLEMKKHISYNPHYK